MRVALYLRVSTDDRQNLDTQRLPLNDFCRAQGWTDILEYADEASAADLRVRSAWRRLMEDAARRRFDLLLVWRLDRMARSVFDAAQSLEQLRHWGIGLRSLQEPYIDTTSPFGEALYFITIAYAGLERGILRERVRAGLERARRQGRHIGRPGGTTNRGFEGRAAKVLPRVRSGSLTVSAAAAMLGVSRSTVRRRLDVASGLTLPRRPGAASGVSTLVRNGDGKWPT